MKKREFLRILALMLALGILQPITLLVELSQAEHQSEVFDGSTSTPESPEKDPHTANVHTEAELFSAIADPEKSTIILNNDIVALKNLEINRDLQLNLNHYNLTSLTQNIRLLDIKYGHVQITGKGSIVAYGANGTAIRIRGATTADNSRYASIIIDQDVNIFAPNQCGILITTSFNAAYGVSVELHGAIIARDGITISQNITARGEHAPTIQLVAPAKITADENEGTAIQALGYGKWQIGAIEITGATGINLAAGNLHLDNPHVLATGYVFTQNNAETKNLEHLEIEDGLYAGRMGIFYGVAPKSTEAAVTNIRGGAFNADVSSYLENGRRLEKNYETGAYMVINDVAPIEIMDEATQLEHASGKLQGLIDFAAEYLAHDYIKGDLGDWTPQAAKYTTNLKRAITIAKKSLKGKPDLDKITSATNGLHKAIDHLQAIGAEIRSELTSIIASVNAIEPNDYTEYSYRQVDEAMQNALGVLNREEARYEEIYSALLDLQINLDLLEIQEEPAERSTLSENVLEKPTEEATDDFTENPMEKLTEVTPTEDALAPTLPTPTEAIPLPDLPLPEISGLPELSPSALPPVIPGSTNVLTSFDNMADRQPTDFAGSAEDEELMDLDNEPEGDQLLDFDNEPEENELVDFELSSDEPSHWQDLLQLSDFADQEEVSSWEKLGVSEMLHMMDEWQDEEEISPESPLESSRDISSDISLESSPEILPENSLESTLDISPEPNEESAVESYPEIYLETPIDSPIVAAARENLRTLLNAVSILNPEEYTARTYATFAETIKWAGDLVLSANSEFELNTAFDQVNNAYNRLEKASANVAETVAEEAKANLQTMMDAVEPLTVSDYEENSAEQFGELQVALAKAKAVLVNPETDLDYIVKLMDEITTATTGLKIIEAANVSLAQEPQGSAEELQVPDMVDRNSIKVDWSELQEVIIKIQQIQPNNYTASSYADMLRQLNRAKDALNDQSITQDSADDIIFDLNLAFLALEPITNEMVVNPEASPASTKQNYVNPAADNMGARVYGEPATATVVTDPAATPAVQNATVLPANVTTNEIIDQTVTPNLLMSMMAGAYAGLATYRKSRLTAKRQKRSII